MSNSNALNPCQYQDQDQDMDQSQNPNPNPNQNQNSLKKPNILLWKLGGLAFTLGSFGLAAFMATWGKCAHYSIYQFVPAGFSMLFLVLSLISDCCRKAGYKNESSFQKFFQNVEINMGVVIVQICVTGFGCML